MINGSHLNSDINFDEFISLFSLKNFLLFVCCCVLTIEFKLLILLGFVLLLPIVNFLFILLFLSAIDFLLLEIIEVYNSSISILLFKVGSLFSLLSFSFSNESFKISLVIEPNSSLLFSKLLIFSSKFISEFKCEPLIITNDKDDIVQKINKNITFFKNWLSSINLSFYYENFINNDIYEISQLIKISKIKTRQEIFSFINTIIKTNKIGHIYRILIKIDIDTGFIDENLSNFLTPKRFLKNQSKSNYSNYSDNELLISGIKNVFCTNKIEERSCIKLFFEKYNLKSLCSNFMNNGFDILEFIILQMFSRFPINDYILEKNMYISDYNDRKKILMILNNEVNKINKMMSSEEYLSYTLNRRIKYEDFFLSNGRDSNFIFNNDDRCDFCQIF